MQQHHGLSAYQGAVSCFAGKVVMIDTALFYFKRPHFVHILVILNHALWFQALLMRGLARSKPCFKQTSLVAIVTMSLR